MCTPTVKCARASLHGREWSRDLLLTSTVQKNEVNKTRLTPQHRTVTALKGEKEKRKLCPLISHLQKIIHGDHHRICPSQILQITVEDLEIIAFLIVENANRINLMKF